MGDIPVPNRFRRSYSRGPLAGLEDFTCLTSKLNERPVVEELLARDPIVLDRVEADFFVRDALPAGFGGKVERRVDAETAGARIGVAAEERPAEFLAVDGIVPLKSLGFADN